MTETKTKLQHESKKRKKEQSESNTLSNALNARKLIKKKREGERGFGKIFKTCSIIQKKGLRTARA